jgi:hypothetical protein
MDLLQAHAARLLIDHPRGEVEDPRGRFRAPHSLPADVADEVPVGIRPPGARTVPEVDRHALAGSKDDRRDLARP